MEVITIESKAYRELMLKLEQLCENSRMIAHIKEAEKQEKDEWIDSKAACLRLNISSRTLHRMIKERMIGYSFLRGRYRFKKSEVEHMLHENHVVSHPETFDELRQPYLKK